MSLKDPQNPESDSQQLEYQQRNKYLEPCICQRPLTLSSRKYIKKSSSAFIFQILARSKKATQKVKIAMDYSNLFLNNELIDNVFKINQKQTKSIGKGFASLVKSGAEKDAVHNVVPLVWKGFVFDCPVLLQLIRSCTQ